MRANPVMDGGIILVDKPVGITSQDAVNAVRRAFGTRQAGHTGTLDPLASGLLTVLVGRAVKASEFAVCNRKKYEAVLRLGIETDTEDITGTVIRTMPVNVTDDAIRLACLKFTGDLLQTPPMYSAIKIGGKKLYELAREGKTVERTPRKITVFDLSAERIDDNDVKLTVECSAGTYIRTLCADIARFLGTCGCMAALRRTSVGHFSVTDAVDTDFLKNADAELLKSRLIPTEELFAELSYAILPVFFERLLSNGCPVLLRKLSKSIPQELKQGDRIRIHSMDGEFLALAEVILYENEPALKSIKLFKI